MKRIVAGARLPLKILSDIQPHRIVPGMPANSNAVHAKLDCITCHEDLDGIERFPHGKVAPVDCGKCHEAAARDYAESVHGTRRAGGDVAAPTCADCHTAHEVQSRRSRNSPTYPRNIPDLCAKCHNDQAPTKPAEPFKYEDAKAKVHDHPKK